MYDTYMDTRRPMFNDDDNRTHLFACDDNELFVLMQDADANAFNDLCEEAWRRGLVKAG